MSSVDWQSLLNTLLVALGAVLVGMIKVYVPRVIDIVEQWVKIKLTDQEREAIVGAAVTGAGILQTKIDQGLLKVKDVHPDNPIVQDAAKAAVDRVPDSAASQGTSVDVMANILVGKVDTSPKVVPVVAAVVPEEPPTSNSETPPNPLTPPVQLPLGIKASGIFPTFNVSVPMPSKTAIPPVEIPPTPVPNLFDRIGAAQPPFQNQQGI